MATNILSNRSLIAPAIVYTSEVDSVSNIDIQAVLSADAVGQVKYTIQRKTANGDWRTARDENNAPLEFATINALEEGINIVGLNAYKIRVKVEILGGAGTLNIEYEIV